MDTLKNKLLNSKPEDLLETLKNSDFAAVDELTNTLVLIWSIHPDEQIKEEAAKLLSSNFSHQQLAAYKEIFAIFQSITDYLPWMGDYQELQQRNYQKFQEGRADFEELLASSTVFINYYLDVGRKLFMLFGLTSEARDCFENIIQYSPTNDEAHYALARVAEKVGDIPMAVEHYGTCLVHNPQHLYANLQLGVLKVEQLEAPKVAMEYYSVVAEQDPYMTEIYIRMAEACHAMEDKKRRNHFIEIALGINEYLEEALQLLGMVQWKEEGDIDAAIETFQKGLDHKIHGDSGILLASLGELHASQLSDYDKAKVFYEKSLKAKPNQADTLIKFVTILENIYQDYGAMATAFEHFLQHTTDQIEIYVAYANFLIKYMHDYEFAKMQLEQALIIDSNNVEANKLMRQIADYVVDEESLVVASSEAEDFEDDDDNDDDFVGGGAAGDS